MLSMTSRTPRYPVSIRRLAQGEGEADSIIHTFFTPNFVYPVAQESDAANFVLFSSIPGTEPILPSPGRKFRDLPKNVSKVQATKPEDDGSVRPCLFRCTGKSRMTRHKRGSDPYSPHARDNNRAINSAPHPSLASTSQTVASEPEDAPMWTTTSSFNGVSTPGEHSDVDELVSNSESIMGVSGSETATSCSYTTCDDQGPMEDIRDQNVNEHGIELDYAGEDDEGAREQGGGSTMDQSNAITNGQLDYFTDYAGVRYYGYRYPPVVDYYGVGMRHPSYPTFGYPYSAGYIHHVAYIPASYNPPSQAFSSTGHPHDETIHQQMINVDAEAEQDVLSSLEVGDDSDHEEASYPKSGRKGYLSWDELLDDSAQLHQPSSL
ncbi:hypothetical protein EIP86_000262 [Pleurotus ostreatoroseus]|nr:hypothetical protein EIP86_000262 [Pleurotus ostreatoroseus]